MKKITLALLVGLFACIVSLSVAHTARAVSPPGPGTSLGIAGECVDNNKNLGPMPSGSNPCVAYSPVVKAQACTYSNGAAGYKNSQGTCYPISAYTSYAAFQATTTNTATGLSSEVKGTCAELSNDNSIVSTSGFIRWLCTTTPDQNRNAVEVLAETLANYIIGLGTFVLILIVAIAGVQIMTGGASPEAIKAGKRRMTLALSSIALLVMGRVVLDLIGVTGERFLGVPVNAFNKDTIPAIISAITQYVFFAGGVLSIAMIIYGGFVMITSAGNPQRIQSARRVITYAVIGLALMLMAGLIVGLVGRALTG